MDFERDILRETEKPDPLWLYKVGTSLIKQFAEHQAQATGRSVIEEARLALQAIDAYGKEPDKSGNAKTALEPLIAAIAGEFSQFNAVFKLENQDKEYIHDQVAKAVIKAYRNSGLLVHLHRLGEMTDGQLETGSRIVVEELNRYGANGLRAMWAAWDAGQRDLLDTLKTDTRKFVPAKLFATKNYSEMSRGKYFEAEWKHAAPKTAEEEEKLLSALIPKTLGPEYCAAREAKEELIAGHITSGITGFGSDMMVQALGLHRNYDRANNEALKKVKTPGYNYVDTSLNLSPKELKNIRRNKPPKTFNEQIDVALGRNRPDKESALGDLQKIVKRVGSGVTEEKSESARPPETSPAAGGTEPKLITHDPAADEGGATTPESEAPKTEKPKKPSGGKKGEEEKTKDPQAPSSGGGGGSGSTPPSEPPKKPDDYKGWVNGGKVATTILGSLLVADQLHRAKDKDTGQDAEHPDKEQERSEKSSKIVHYVLAAAAAAGVALVVFTKPEKLVKFVSSISEFFGKSGPSKA